jgi:hypothetical protein
MAHIDENLEGACLVPSSDEARLNAIWEGKVQPRTGAYYQHHYGAHHPTPEQRGDEKRAKRRALEDAAKRLRAVPVDERSVNDSQFLLRAQRAGIIADCGYAPRK